MEKESRVKLVVSSFLGACRCLSGSGRFRIDTYKPHKNGVPTGGPRKFTAERLCGGCQEQFVCNQVKQVLDQKIFSINSQGGK